MRIADSKPWGALGLLIAAVLLQGCVSTAEDIAAHLAERSLKRQHLFTVIEGDLALYRSCLKERGGACQGAAQTALPQAAEPQQPATPVRAALGASVAGSVGALPDSHAARLAADALGHPALQDAVHLHNYLRGHEPGSSAGFAVATQEGDGGDQSTVSLNLSVSKSQDLADKVHRATAAGGWDALAGHTSGVLERSTAGSEGNEEIRQDHRRAQFIKKYIEAYFRNGRFVAVDFKIDAAKAQADLAAELSKHSKLACVAFNAGRQGTSDGGSDDCSGLAKALYDSLRGSDASVDYQLLKVSQVGFVSRDAGYSARFPEFQIDIDPLASHLVSITTEEGGSIKKIDFTRIGTDLVRIFLEAVFDAHEGLPAVQQATARELGDLSLPLFDPTTGNVSAADLSEMVKVNQRVEAATGAVLNRVIRGIGPISLNNEALEELIVTLVSVSVRKAVEKATWCWYSCDLDVELKQAETAAKAALEEDAEKAEGKLKDFARRTANRVKVDLKVGE